VQTPNAIGEQNAHTDETDNSADLLRIATAGSVDDGKSTLIGRLLLDSKQILEDQLQAVERTSRERGDPYLELSLLTDGLRAEREQGITIDVCYRYFTTPARSFVIADTPGHVRYTRNMVTGASTADLSVILVDARNGVVEQSKRHAAIALLLRTPHIVVCVNKMDLVGYSRQRFCEIAEQFRAFAANLDQTAQISFIPISALEGDNVVEQSQRMGWYEGPSLLSHLESVSVDPEPHYGDGRFPVQWVIRTSENGGYRGYAGQMTDGVLRPNDDVVVLPSGQRSRIASIDSHGEALEAAFSPMSVALCLTDDLDVGRGDLICPYKSPATVSREIDAIVCWMSDRPVGAQAGFKLKHTTRTTQAVVEAVSSRIEIETLRHDDSADELRLNDIGRLRLKTSDPLATDPYNRNRTTGSFILIDEQTHETAGAGMILDATPAAPSAFQSTEASSRQTALTRTQRFQALGQMGATVVFTGSSAKNRQAVMAHVEQSLVCQGVSAYRLDPEALDVEIEGYATPQPTSPEYLACLLADTATVVLVGSADDQDFATSYARRLHQAHGLAFLEVAVDVPAHASSGQAPSLQHNGGVGPADTRDIAHEGTRICDLVLERVIEQTPS
jgi:bifunctional enzyme CysN/CysC